MEVLYKGGYQCQIPPLLDIYTEVFGYKTDGYFVEVGAFDCYTWSNTWPLAQAGWHGIYYEPQPDMVAKCREYYGDTDNIIIRQMALSDEPGTATLYLGGSISTIDKETRDEYMKVPWSSVTGHGDGKSINVVTSTLDIELESLSWPVGFDVLVVDTEGTEYKVLSGLTISKWLPTLCIVESHDLHKDEYLAAKAGAIDEYFEAAGYDKIYTDSINSIYKLGALPHVKEAGT